MAVKVTNVQVCAIIEREILGPLELDNGQLVDRWDVSLVGLDSKFPGHEQSDHSCPLILSRP